MKIVRLSWMLALCCGAAIFGPGLIPHAQAGPIPGVEDMNGPPVDFPLPSSATGIDLGNERYLITFRWKPAGPVTGAAIAGSFNSWSRTANPMAGPDADGWYTGAVVVPAGEHQYKFTANAPEALWLADPGNPDVVGDVGNSLLRTGLEALMHGRKATNNDGTIEMRAFLHDPTRHLYFDPTSARDVVIRCRTLVGDASGAHLVKEMADGTTVRRAMFPAGGTSIYDFWEVHLKGEPPTRYWFELEDQGTDARGVTPTRIETAAQTFAVDESTIFRTPEWARSAVWYQIMVDRFRNGDPTNDPEKSIPWRHRFDRLTPEEAAWKARDNVSFYAPIVFFRMYGGDFQGVIEKLDYLEDLGVTAIYFNPVFAAQGSHKYNTRTYIHASDDYGVRGGEEAALAVEDYNDPKSWIWTESDRLMLELLREAKRRNIRVIVDGVFNHVGMDFPPLEDVRRNKQQSRYADWLAVQSWDPFKVKGWAGFELPEFRKDDVNGIASDDAREHLFHITRRWMDPNGDGDPSDGIDGWRLDVPMDVPHVFWRQWRQVVKETNPDAYIVGEIWDPAEEWLDGRHFDAVMNYQFSKAGIRFFVNRKDKTTASEFDRELAKLRSRYPRAATYVLQNLWDSHDTDRLASMIMNPDRDYDGANRIQDGAAYDESRPTAEAYERLRLMAMFQFAYVGAPMIWYGTEVGMYGADDPNCRKPMLWADLEPYDDPSVDFVDRGMLRYFRRLMHVRRDTPVLATGDYRTLLADDGRDCFVYLRWSDEDRAAVICAVNNSPHRQRLVLDAPEQLGGRWSGLRTLHTTHRANDVERDSGRLAIELEPRGGVLIRARNAAAQRD